MSNNSSQREDKPLAVASHVLGIITSFIGPLIIYFVSDESKSFAKENAAKALNFQIPITIAYIIASVLGVILTFIIGFIGTLLQLIVFVYSAIFSIKAAMAVNNGEDFEYPINLNIVK